MVIMLSVAGILTAGAARYSVKTSAENSGNALGTVLGEINKALGTYTTYNYKALVDGTANLAPSITDLQNAGLLNANINPTPPMGGGYAIQITREPAGCVAPNCNLTTRVWFTQPVTNPDTGRIDIAKLGAATGVLGGDGGWSDNISPDTVKGTGGWSRPNPAGSQAGILMAINGYGSSAFSQYVDRAGTQGMLANLKMGNNSITGAATINANQVVLPGGNSLMIGNSAYYGDGLNSAIRQSGSTYFQHLDGSAANIAQVGDVQSSGTVNTTNMNAAGNVEANGNINSGGSMNVGGNLVASQVYSNGETSTNGWFRTNGDSGWYSQKWNGGIYMSDGQWVRSYAVKNMYTGGQMQAGSLQSNSDLTVARNLSVAGNQTVGSQTVYGQQVVGGQQMVVGSQVVYGNVAVTNAVTPGQIASEGAYCGGNAGSIARDANNNLFICN
jgi:hypothetical protein